MDFIQTLHSLEEAVYEIVTWVLFLPKTLVKVFFRPDWIQGYVTAEFEKEPAERFQAYLSPILLWLIVAVVPFAAAASIKLEVNSHILNVSLPDTSVLLLITLLLMAIPALFACVLLRFKKLPLEREPLKRLLYMQCYPAAIFELSVLPRLALVAVTKNSVSPEMLITIQAILVVGGLWFYIGQIIVFKQELAIPWFEAMWRAMTATLLSFVILPVVIFLYSLLLIVTGAVQIPSG